MKSDKPEVIICACHSVDHQMIFRPDEEETIQGPYRSIYVSIHLLKRPFWERVKYGFKYIFGYQCRYGAFDEMILDTKDNKDKFKEAVEFLEGGINT